jgi:hypothetical protein
MWEHFLPKNVGTWLQCLVSIRREVPRKQGRVRSRKAAKNRFLAIICQSVRRVRGTELMLRTFWIKELHRSTNSSDQLYRYFFCRDTVAKCRPHTRHTSMKMPQFCVVSDFYRDINEICALLRILRRVWRICWQFKLCPRGCPEKSVWTTIICCAYRKRAQIKQF